MPKVRQVDDGDFDFALSIIKKQREIIENLKKMKKGRRIRELEAQLEQAHDDYQHTHDSLWKVLEVLCGEFGLKLTIKPRDEDA